jgi:hypothetical protein
MLAHWWRSSAQIWWFIGGCSVTHWWWYEGSSGGLLVGVQWLIGRNRYVLAYWWRCFSSLVEMWRLFWLIWSGSLVETLCHIGWEVVAHWWRCFGSFCWKVMTHWWIFVAHWRYHIPFSEWLIDGGDLAQYCSSFVEMFWLVGGFWLA